MSSACSGSWSGRPSRSWWPAGSSRRRSRRRAFRRGAGARESRGGRTRPAAATSSWTRRRAGSGRRRAPVRTRGALRRHAPRAGRARPGARAHRPAGRARRRSGRWTRMSRRRLSPGRWPPPGQPVRSDQAAPDRAYRTYCVSAALAYPQLLRQDRRGEHPGHPTNRPGIDRRRRPAGARRRDPATPSQALPHLRTAAELVTRAIDEAMAFSVLNENVSIRAAAQLAGLSENAVGPRLARTAALASTATRPGGCPRRASSAPGTTSSAATTNRQHRPRPRCASAPGVPTDHLRPERPCHHDRFELHPYLVPARPVRFDAGHRHRHRRRLRRFHRRTAGTAGRCTVSLAQFDNQYDEVYRDVPVADVPPLVLVPRGSTALLDSIGRLVNETAPGWQISPRSTDQAR